MKSEFWKNLSESKRLGLISIFLALATGLAYWRVATADFVNYDDPGFVYANSVVTSGLTYTGIVWALFTSYYDFWHPLTWWSHMLACELFGTSAPAHHLVNLGFHIANTILLFVVLRRMTGATYRSAVVAGLFALHPLHVESVAWIAERKDVLSTLFGILCLWSYSRYVEEKAGGSNGGKYYRLTCGFLALGLMAKSMLVTLPFVLLLLDYWPLKRLDSLSTAWARFREKLPLFGLSLASSLITYLGMHAGENVLSTEKVSLGLRLANATVSYVQYLIKLVWPTDLVVLYPMPPAFPWWQVAGALVILLIISGLALAFKRSLPYLLVGWCFFLGTLVPVIGVVAMGSHSIADRYTYIPAIGIFVLFVWLAAEVSFRWKMQPQGLAAAVILLLGLGWLTQLQVRHWRNSFTLWTHCLEVNPGNAIAEYNLGHHLQHGGAGDAAAIPHYQAALRLKPEHLDANLNLGVAFSRLERYGDATNYFAKTLQLKPDYENAHLNMAYALYRLQDFTGASNHLARVLALNPNNTGAQNSYNEVLTELERVRQSPVVKP